MFTSKKNLKRLVIVSIALTLLVATFHISAVSTTNVGKEHILGVFSAVQMKNRRKLLDIEPIKMNVPTTRTKSLPLLADQAILSSDFDCQYPAHGRFRIFLSGRYEPEVAEQGPLLQIIAVPEQ